MRNSWCKVENGVVVDGPRAWADNSPPDATWLPHDLEDPGNPDPANYVYGGSHHEVRGSQVIEVKEYRILTDEEKEEIARQIAQREAEAAEETQGDA